MMINPVDILSMNGEVNNKRNPYINAKGQRELKKSIVAFVDILGFKELVINAKNEGRSKNLFDSFYNALSTWSNHIKDMNNMASDVSFSQKKDTYIIRIFTDCILIGSPIKISKNKYTIEGENELWEILSILYIFQLEMVSHGYFVRGAISVDELYMDDVIIYGNGIIDAYEAESKQAKFPRIILTKSAESMFLEINKGFVAKQSENYLNQYLNKDSDGYLFLNYLESIKIGDSDFQFTEHLEKHQNMIKKNLRKHNSTPHLLEKYIWAANYHNFFCNQPPSYEKYIIDLTEYQMNVMK